MLDFWNNPIVVSAFRVRYRRGGFTNTLAPYLVVLAAIGAGLEYYQDKMQVPWARIYYPILMGLQFLGLGVMASTATAASLRSEVVNRTLDFQRIAALSPRQILLGKLLGEPAVAYLMAMASFPLAVWCFLAGGVDLEVMLLMYVNLATTLLLCGAAGLIGRIELPVGQATGVIISIWALGTPIPLFVGIARRNPWLIEIPLFGVDIPYMLLLPPVQLLLAYVCFRIMERQLITPLNPMISKPLAYAILAGVDLVSAALLFNLTHVGSWDTDLGTLIGRRGVVFCLVHLFAGLALTFGMTAWRETLYSWVWRFRRRRPLLVDLWLGDRSENVLSLGTFAVMGLVNLALFVVLPTVWWGRSGPWPGPSSILDPQSSNVWLALPTLIAAATTTAVLILAFGTIHQWLLLIAGRVGSTITFLLAAMATFIPLAGGFRKQTEWTMSFSPALHYAHWLGLNSPRDPQPAFSYLVLVVLYLVVFILFWYLLRARMRKLEAWVDFKLRMMGALPPAAPIHP